MGGLIDIEPDHLHGEVGSYYTRSYCLMCKAVKADRAELAEKVRGLKTDEWGHKGYNNAIDKAVAIIEGEK
jgi:hypothetical protein